jgi:hypothetical protein
MPDHSTTPADLNVKKRAFLNKVVERVVREFKVDRGWVRENVDTVVSKRVYVGEHGPIRVLRPGSMGEFYPGAVDDEDIMAPLLHEIVEAAPDEVKLEHLRQREEQVAQFAEEKRNNPRNWL